MSARRVIAGRVISSNEREDHTPPVVDEDDNKGGGVQSTFKWTVTIEQNGSQVVFFGCASEIELYEVIGAMAQRQNKAGRSRRRWWRPW